MTLVFSRAAVHPRPWASAARVLLFASAGMDLRATLRAGASDGELADLLRAAWIRREEERARETGGETLWERVQPETLPKRPILKLSEDHRRGAL